MIILETTGYGYSKRLCKDVVCWFVSEYLPRYKLEIEVLHRGLNKEKVIGYCDISGETYRPRSFLIEINTYLSKKDYIKVLCHELWHMYQWVKGEMKYRSSKRYFDGECVDDLDYWEQPHEIEAHYFESILYQDYLKHKGLTRI
jgi:hypothetical protein